MKARSNVAAAGDGGLVEVRDADAHDVRILRGADRGAALAALEREVGHLAEAFARAEHVEQLAVLGDLALALGQQAEEVAGLAFLHQLGAGRHALPQADAHHFPQLGSAKLREEGHGA